MVTWRIVLHGNKFTVRVFTVREVSIIFTAINQVKLACLPYFERRIDIKDSAKIKTTLNKRTYLTKNMAITGSEHIHFITI